jgi:hypothetical protein
MSPPTVTFCDCSGLNAILHAAQQTTVTGGTLRLHYPPPMSALLVDLTGCAFLLLGRPFGHLSPPLGDAPVASRPHRTAPHRTAPHRTAPHRHVPMMPVLSGDVR